MAINPHNSAIVTFQDYDLETSRFEVNCAIITAANATAQGVAFALLATQAGLITLGVQLQQAQGMETERFNPAPSANPLNQREAKWLVRYSDNVTFKVYGVTLPTADLSLLPAGNSNKLDLSGPPASNFVSAFEAFALSPDGNPVNIIEIVHVGRNL